MERSLILSAHQPNFLPWTGFFKKMFEADIFVILDDVQLGTRSYTQRTKLPFEQGLWLSVPVKKKGKYPQKINEAEIDNSVRWQKKHIRTLKHYFRGFPHFQEIYPNIEIIYKQNYKYLAELNIRFIRFIMDYLGIKKKLLFSSAFDIKEKKDKRILKLLELTGCNTYLSGVGGKKYIDKEKFVDKGYKIIFKDFSKGHTEYSIIYEMFLNGKDILNSANYKRISEYYG